MGNLVSTENSHYDPLPALAELEREITLNPLQTTVLLECLDSPADELGNNHEGTNTADKEAGATSGQENEAEAKQAQDARVREHLMRVEVAIPEQYRRCLTTSQHRSHLIVVADKSGSMAGNPWKQTQQALIDIVSSSLMDSSLLVDIVLYNNVAKFVQYTQADYQEKLNSVGAGGSTSFVAAFDAVDKVLTQRAGERFSSTTVMFMTDGSDTVSSKKELSARLDVWKAHLASVGRDVTIHTVGFTRDHDLQFLQNLSSAGTNAGLFRYCEPGDGPEKLQEKVEELFDYAVYASKPNVNVAVEMDGENKIISLGQFLQKDSVRGNVNKTDAAGQTVDAANTGTQMFIQAEMWVLLQDASKMPAPIIHLNQSIKVADAVQTVHLPCVCGSVEKKIIEDAGSRALFGLSLLTRNTDILASKLGSAIEKNKDVTNLQPQVARLQKRLSGTRVFGAKITKEMRATLLSAVQDIQAKLDLMHNMLARYTRGETATVSILARAHDMRFEAQFNKSRRQRLMDQRAVTNMKRAKEDEAKLDELAVDEADIAKLSQEAIGFFFCSLSQNSVVDILRDFGNKENAIGFGLAVTRPEFALDDPTAVKLWLISGTLVSRTSMLDAFEYKINTSSHLQAHSGFNFFNNDLGYATVGLSREPINAWLPLYVSPSHWQRVKAVLKPSLAYLCTLDPLGFDWKQLDVMFMVLGSMIGQLNPSTVSLHQLRLLFAFQRTCTACIEDFNLTNRIETAVREFIREPGGRFKNIIPNLCTLIGYIAALPVNKSRKLLGYEENTGGSSQPPAKFWLAYLTEALRRAAGQFKGYSDRDIQTLVDLILHGREHSLMLPSDSSVARAREVQVDGAGNPLPPSSPSGTAAAVSAQSASTATHFTVLCNTLPTMGNADLHIRGVEPAGAEAGGEKKPEDKAPPLPDITKKESMRMDRAMEVWAQAKVSPSKAKNQSESVAKSMKQVDQWLKEGLNLAGLPDMTDPEEIKKKEERERFNYDEVDSSILKITATLVTRLSRVSQPALCSIPGAMAYLHAWLDGNECMTEVTNSLPPDTWVNKMKAAVTEMYTAMAAYNEECSQQMSVSEGDIEEVVIVGKKAGGDQQKTDDVDYDYDSGEDYEEYYFGEENPIDRMKKMREESFRLVTLPMILNVLDPSRDKINLTRAMLCQALQYSTNSKAKDAAIEGRFVDLKEQDAVVPSLCDLHLRLVQACANTDTNPVMWQRANAFMLKAGTVWAFIGYLMNTYKDRDEGFSLLLSAITNLNADAQSAVPCLPEKVKVMLMGQWEEHNVLARGNACYPGKDLCKKLEKALGEEAWTQIELDLRGENKIHVYRESDIPNRHGHCNSNPYIPRALRLKLGMPVL